MSETENRLLSVVEHWLPRMEVAGIPSATAKTVIDSAGVWENWLAAWSAEGDRHAEMGEAALARGRKVTAGEAFARASLFYHFGQFMAFDDLVAKERVAAMKVEAFRRAAPLLEQSGELIEVPFEGGILRGYLRRPARQGPHPLALIIPGSDSTKEEFPAFERHFLIRGMATLSLDGPGQGEGRSHGYLRADIAPAIAATIKALENRPGLTGDIGLVGMAFGGFLALRAAAALEGLAAVVSINGFYDLGALWPTLPKVYQDNMSFALGDDVVERACRFTLAGIEGPVVPALVLHGGLDKIFPPSEAQKCAEICRAGSELHVFPTGNHVCNNIPWMYRPLVADWLAERLKV
ncbi:alpha/beta fold hydrolase [Shinella kummerowiae]|jgi:dienelactone hydrolase|uniref:Alpha/beta fold hydrolase n=1 Tax=Shinella kummerowiae TaxID=417745 RepID=A0A6N8S9D2_9HYPH|nr:alpha/beta fold hydrolase [Shinella kummerowiae]MXN45579.1 alpha/beta fold hydrolase [Shinella kummerowiae]